MRYEDIAKINVNEHVEKKNNLSYLSWAWAVDQLLRLDSSATWEYREPVRYGDTLMVFCTVKAFGVERTAQLPVMDHRNKAIANPDAFQVNTAMQRALAKAIALHGLGLYIYAGEDLPEGEEPPKPKATAKPVSQDVFDTLQPDEQDYLRSVAVEMKLMLAKNDAAGALQHIHSLNLDTDERVALNALFDSKERAAMKKARDIETIAEQA